MLNAIQHPWPGAIRSGPCPMFCAQRRKDAKMSGRPRTGFSLRPCDRPRRRRGKGPADPSLLLCVFASLRETKKCGAEGQVRPRTLKRLGDRPVRPNSRSPAKAGVQGFRLAPRPAAPAGRTDLGGLSATPPSAAEGAVADRQAARGIAEGLAAEWNRVMLRIAGLGAAYRSIPQFDISPHREYTARIPIICERLVLGLDGLLTYTSWAGEHQTRGNMDLLKFLE